jgi:hypothetical protein
LGLGTALLAAQYGNGVDPGVGLRNGPHVVAAQAAGTPILQLFYRGLDGQLWTLWQKAGRSWSNAVSLGGSVSSDPVAEKVPGTDILHVFYRGPDGAVWTLWRTPDGTWSNHVSLGGFLPTTDTGIAKPIAMQVPGPNVLQLFYRGGDHGLYTRWRRADGTWAPTEERLSPPLGQRGSYLGGDPVIGPFAQVFWTELTLGGEPGAVWGVVFDPDSNGWSSPGILGGRTAWGGTISAGPVLRAAVVPGTTVTQVFYQGAHSLVTTRWSTPTGWSDEQSLPTASSGPEGVGFSLGGSFDNLAVVQVPGTDLLQIFGRAVDQNLWTQSRTPDGHWPEAYLIAGTGAEKGPDLMGAPVAAADPNANTLHVFYWGEDNGLWTLSRNADETPTGVWSDIRRLAGNVAGDVCTAVVPA